MEASSIVESKKDCSMKYLNLLRLSSVLLCFNLPYSYANNGPENHPLISFEDFTYKGGFRISGGTFGDRSDTNTNANYSRGIMTFNPKNNSLFLVGHTHGNEIAEFKIPEVVNSTNILDFKMIDKSIQNFSSFYKTERVDTGIDNFFRITGMELINDKLLVSYVNWYNALSEEFDTSVVFENADDLANSVIKGPYQIEGSAHAAGSLSPIPTEWQSALGGDIMAGNHAGTSIISRLSVGPTAFPINSQQFLNKPAGSIASFKLLDFPYSNFLHDKNTYSEAPYGGGETDAILYNLDLKNKLWTMLSGASYGFIVPKTRTYVTIGGSGGHNFGAGYKITQDDGTQCAGPCSVKATDNSAYYWLWDLNDLVKVKNEKMQAHEVRPYEYGPIDIPVKELNNSGVGGAAFDVNNNMLYLSFSKGDELQGYNRTPLFLAYKFEQLPDTSKPNIESDIKVDEAKNRYEIKVKLSDLGSGINAASLDFYVATEAEQKELGNALWNKNPDDCYRQPVEFSKATNFAIYHIAFDARFIKGNNYVVAIKVKDVAGNENTIIQNFTH